MLLQTILYASMQQRDVYSPTHHTISLEVLTNILTIKNEIHWIALVWINILHHNSSKNPTKVKKTRLEKHQCGVMLSEISQSEKDRYCMLSFISEI